MARFSSILVPSCDADIAVSLTTTAQSAIQTIGKNRIFVVNCPADIQIVFALAASSNQPTISSSTYRIPANQQTTFDTGNAFDSFYLANLASGSNTAYIKLLSVQ